ncbi:SusC/RagA family TonB-linked outer membrane protein [Bacteroidia bacterium]|nr:SusC/RagA family TonB-linked outer membrane protein [Bacteroidia bacterium]
MKLNSLFKFFLFFCALPLIPVVANAQNTKITITNNSISVKQLITEIEKQTDFLVLLRNNDVDVNQTIQLKEKSGDISVFLSEAFRNTDVSYEFQNKYIVLTTNRKVNGQQTITGTVTDATGEAIIGVGVSVKGANIGTATDINGKFSLTTAPGAVLTISYIGYKTQEMAIGNNTHLNITLLEDALSLDEVVVVGFGTQKKVNLTGAVGTVSSKDLQNRPVQNVQQALQGLVAGLNIAQTNGQLDATPSINIRGTGNLGTGSSAAPLVLVDGVESNLSHVNPQDIENISVLKDAAASSIYGSRAPFGVILITTKKGTAGKITVNYNNNFRWNSPTIRPHSMDSYSLGAFINDAAVNSNLPLFVTDERMQRIKDFQNGLITTEVIPDPANPTRWLGSYGQGNANNDIYGVYFTDWAASQEHNVSAGGGNDRFTFYMSLGYLNQNGLLNLGSDNYQKFTPTATIEAKVTDWMKLRYTTRFIRSNYSKPTALNDALFNNIGRQGWSWMALYDPNGYFMANNWPVLELAEGGKTEQQRDNYNNHASLTLEPVRNWITTADVNYNITSFSQHAVQLQTFGHDMAGEPYLYREASYVGNSFTKSNFLNLNVYSAYNFSLDNHNFGFLVGGQMEDLKSDAFNLQRNGVIVNDLPVVDLTSGLNYNGTTASPAVGGNMSEWSTAGFFGRFNYDWQGRYLLEANLRYDGTSRFREDKRWNWFSSFSAGWNIAREAFWSDLSNTVSLLKLRGSYGKLGNQNTDTWYPTYQVISVTANSGSWLQNGAKTNVANSPNLISTSLTWEQINTWQVAVDVAAFKNRLTGSFDYYQRKTLNMVGPAEELPNILGKTVPRSNNTDLKTYGFELELGWQDRLANGLSYSAKFLLSDYQTEITRYPNATKSLSTYYEGQKLGSIWGYETIGIAKSNEEMDAHLASLPEGGQNAIGSQWAAGDIMYRDLNGDGKINAGSSTFDEPGDRKIIGNNTPRFQFGLNLSAEWKGFDARIFFQGVAKRDYWNGSSTFFGNTSFWNIEPLREHVDYFRSQPSYDLPTNLDAYYPRPLQNGYAKNQQVQTRYLQNAAYIRLKNVTVGYTLPQTVTQKFYVSGLRVFVSGENLWTGTKLAKMFDPESISGVSGQGGYYPLMKILSCGLSITL